jgi:cytochrome bd-type quinol oxidase subunit 2
MVARARLLQARVLPHGLLDALRQVSLFAAAYIAYRLVRGLVEGDANAAFAHARDVISIESKLHLFVEPSVQAWASGSHFVMVSASWLYVNAQTSITLSALLYLYLRHNRSFYFVRNMFMIAMAIALVGYIVFPTAPSRCSIRTPACTSRTQARRRTRCSIRTRPCRRCTSRSR